MFGILVEEPANVFCDNHGIIKNASIPESTLAKKHNAINYHAVSTAGILHVGKEKSQTNLANLLTKVLTSEQQWDICWHIMW